MLTIFVMLFDCWLVGSELIMQRDHLDLNEVPHFMLSPVHIIAVMWLSNGKAFQGDFPTSCEPDPHIIDFVNAPYNSEKVCLPYTTHIFNTEK